jgi:class 3 adenylate cyclase
VSQPDDIAVNRSADPSEADKLRALIDRRLVQVSAPTPVRVLGRRRLRALASALNLVPTRDDAQGGARELTTMLGVDATEAEAEVDELLALARSWGISLGDIVPIAQAYYRGVARIVEAEVEALEAILRRAPQGGRLELMERLMDDPVVDAPGRVFALLHASLLRAALLDELSTRELDAPSPSLAVALVDLSGSTAYLEDSGREATQHLVDALFEAGQSVTAPRPARVVKYVGDGMFLAARDAQGLADACFEAIAQLAETVPLPARAGLAYGPLVRHAGDYFGFPINMAQRLTKVAAPRTVLASVEAAARIDPTRHGRRRRLRLPGSAKRRAAVELAPPTP